MNFKKKKMLKNLGSLYMLEPYFFSVLLTTKAISNQCLEAKEINTTKRAT